MTTKIEWADEVWNPVTGCSKISEGCRNCYAERLALRKLQSYDTGLPWTAANAEKNVVLHEDRLNKPLRWKRPRRVFVNSMSDLFHVQVPFEFVDRVFAAMALSTRHTFQVLTKRPERMLRWFTADRVLSTADEDVACAAEAMTDPEGRRLRTWDARGDKPERYYHVGSPPTGRDLKIRQPWPGWPLPNVWLGVSVEDQKTAVERIPLLLQTPAAVRFVSAEPLLGPIDLQHYVLQTVPRLRKDYPFPSLPPRYRTTWVDALDQVIVGGESGPGARPMHPDWARSIRDQCIEAGVAFHFKQWGEWALPPQDMAFDTTLGHRGRPPAFLVAPDGTVHCTRDAAGDAAVPMVRVGKKAAGRKLDGRTWDEEPAHS